MERPHHVVPDSLLRDNRRNSWILVLPARDFFGGEAQSDLTVPDAWAQTFEPVQRESPSRAVSAGLMERVLPFVMLVWAGVVWTFLFYELGHL